MDELEIGQNVEEPTIAIESELGWRDSTTAKIL